MLEDIIARDFPHSRGVYWFKDVDGVIIYVGSSNNLYTRMEQHRSYIKKGNCNGGKTDFYQFLQSNQFTVEFQLEEDYRQLEQQLIETYNPKYNQFRAYTGYGARKGREAEYSKARYRECKEDYKQRSKQYRESHKEEIKQYFKQRNNQLCNFNGENLTLNALRKRFQKLGIPHPTLEAKKYLIS